MTHKKVKVEVFLMSSDIKMPVYATEGAACFDFAASEDKTVLANATAVIPTGLKVAVPMGYELQVRPRSGLSLKTAVRVANSPGTIDSDYRGEVGIILHNTANVDLHIKKGDRVAQGCIKEVIKVDFDVVGKLSETVRGEGGFGSTGV